MSSSPSPALLTCSFLASSAGALTFVGGAADVGKDGRVRNPGGCLVQVEGALANVAEVLLDDEGCGLRDVVRVKAYYLASDAVDEAALRAAVARLLPTDPPPVDYTCSRWSCSRCRARRSRSRSSPSAAGARGRTTPWWSPPARPRGRCRATVGLRAGEFVTVGGQTATGDGQLERTGPEQTRAVMESLEKTLRQLGASFADAVKKEGYYGGTTMDEWSNMAEVRASFFTEPGLVATVLPWQAPAPADAATKIEALAMRERRNGLDKYIPREESWPARVWDWPVSALPYRQGIRLRDSIWLGGQVPWEPYAATGLPMLPGRLAPQTAFVMSYIAEIRTASTAGPPTWPSPGPPLHLGRLLRAGGCGRRRHRPSHRRAAAAAHPVPQPAHARRWTRSSRSGGSRADEDPARKRSRAPGQEGRRHRRALRNRPRVGDPLPPETVRVSQWFDRDEVSAEATAAIIRDQGGQAIALGHRCRRCRRRRGDGGVSGSDLGWTRLRPPQRIHDGAGRGPARHLSRAVGPHVRGELSRRLPDRSGVPASHGRKPARRSALLHRFRHRSTDQRRLPGLSLFQARGDRHRPVHRSGLRGPPDQIGTSSLRVSPTRPGCALSTPAMGVTLTRWSPIKPR